MCFFKNTWFPRAMYKSFVVVGKKYDPENSMNEKNAVYFSFVYNFFKKPIVLVTHGYTSMFFSLGFILR